MPQGVDYSVARPDPHAIAAAGFVAVGRYLGNDSRCLTIAERDALFAANLPIWLIWETTTSRMDAGGPAGAADGRAANGYADAVGWPTTRPIYYANDEDEYQTDPIAAYLDAVRANGSRPRGIYGGAWIVEWCLEHGYAEFGWVSNASSWDHHQGAPRAHIHQGGPAFGGACDTNDLLATDFGQWHPTLTPEDDMPNYRDWSQQDKDALAADVARKVGELLSGRAKVQGQDWAFADDAKQVPYPTIPDAVTATNLGAAAVGAKVIDSLKPGGTPATPDDVKAEAQAVVDELTRRLEA